MGKTRGKLSVGKKIGPLGDQTPSGQDISRPPNAKGHSNRRKARKETNQRSDPKKETNPKE